MHYVGLDIHARSTSVEILDSNGKLVKRGEWKVPWPQLAEPLRQQSPALAVCFEALSGHGYLYDQFAAIAQQVKAAHPGSLRLIYKSKQKNNRVDAGKLAGSCISTRCRRCMCRAKTRACGGGRLMVEAAWQGIRRSPTIRAFYDRVTRKDPDRKKIAVVAAHYMTRVAVSMLKSGQSGKRIRGWTTRQATRSRPPGLCPKPRLVSHRPPEGE